MLEYEDYLATMLTQIMKTDYSRIFELHYIAILSTLLCRWFN